MTAEKENEPMTARWYTGSGDKNPLIDASAIDKHLHRMFANWVAAGCHLRDFVIAMEDSATIVYTNYLLAGRPMPRSLDAMEPIRGMARIVEVPREAPLLRFYTEDGSLSADIDTEPYGTVLAELMEHWIAAHYHPRDFIQAVRDTAITVYYLYDICVDMNGLGGCRTAKEFLSEPFLTN